MKSHPSLSNSTPVHHLGRQVFCFHKNHLFQRFSKICLYFGVFFLRPITATPEYELSTDRFAMPLNFLEFYLSHMVNPKASRDSPTHGPTILLFFRESIQAKVLSAGDGKAVAICFPGFRMGSVDPSIQLNITGWGPPKTPYCKQSSWQTILVAKKMGTSFNVPCGSLSWMRGKK